MTHESASGNNPEAASLAGSEQGMKQTVSQGDFASKFALLAKQEAKLRAQKDRYSSLESTKSEYDSLRELAKNDPRSALEKLGLTVEDLVSRELSSLRDPKEVEGDEIRNKLKSLEEKLTEKERIETEQKNQAALQAQMDTIRKMVDSSDEFELIKTREAYDLVWDAAIEYYNQTGKFVDYSEAAKHVEEHLEAELERLLATKKLQNKFKSVSQSKEDYLEGINTKSDGLTLRNEGNVSKVTPDTNNRDELFRRALELLK